MYVKTIVASLEAEYTGIVNTNTWFKLFQSMDRESGAKSYPCVESKKLQNKILNRYRDVTPYDHSRIVLKRSDIDYINANLVKVESANRKYILTQGPLNSTIEHFWLMVWEQKSNAIVMLNNLIEKNDVKCSWYWPQTIGEQHKMNLPKVKLTVEQTTENNYGYYSTREFRITDTVTSTSRKVVQFHYTTWPDFGVPASPTAVLDFLQQIKKSGVFLEDSGPAVVHCSAGIGRSGTLCLIDSCLTLIEMGAESINVQRILLELRKNRMGLVQTPDQLQFSYQAIIEGAKRLDSTCGPSEDLYSIVAEESNEEIPPSPPPRSGSLSIAPERPLPSTPTGNLAMSVSDESDSDGQSSQHPCDSAVSSADDEDDEEDDVVKVHSLLVEKNRRRRNRDPNNRSSSIRTPFSCPPKFIKRCLFKPLCVSLGIIVTSALLYLYYRIH